MKKFLSFIFALALLVIAFGCGDKEEKLSKITISKDVTTVEVGKTISLKVTFEPADAQNKEVEWATSDQTIASVSSAGFVKGNKTGTVTITVTSKENTSIKDSINISVVEGKKVSPTSLSVWGYSDEVIVGYTSDFFVTFTPEETTEKFVNWTSSDEEVATIDANGVVTGVKPGKCVITAQSAADPNVKGEKEITVKEAIDITDLTITLSDEDIVIGYTFKVSAVTTPTGGNQQLEWSSSDENIATVNANGVITPVSVGEVTITAKVKNKNIERQLVLNVINPPALTDFTISNARNITTNETCTLGVDTTPKYAQTNIEWSVDNEAVATIDKLTGKLTPVTTGKVTVTAVDKTINVTKNVVITITEAFNADAKPTSIIITGDDECYVGYTILLVAQVFPAGVSQKVTWQSSNNEIATVDETGKLTALKEGTVRIKAFSVQDNSVSSTYYKVTVSKEPEAPKAPNLGGYEIIIMNADSALAEIDPFLEGYSMPDKEYKQKAWRDVESEFNCKIKVEAYPSTAPWGPQRINWINDNAMTNNSLLDFGVVSAAWLYKFVQANSVVDTTDFFKKYGKKQIEAAQREAGSYQGKMYIVSTGISQTKTFPYKGLFYNFGMLKELGLESPAKLFNEDKWSYEEFVEYCVKAQALMPEGKYVMSGGPSIVWAGMVNAAGIKIADKTTVTLNLTHTYSLDAVNALKQVVEAGAWAIDAIGYDQNCEPFQNGDALFQPGDYWFVRSDNRFPAKLWGEDTQYGYVPFPYPKTVGKENTMVNDLGGSIMIMVAGRNHPADVSEEGIFYALQTMYIKTVQYQEADPDFDSSAIKYNSARANIDDPESVEATVYFNAAMTLYDPLFEESFQNEWGGTNGEATNAVINAVKGADPTEEFDKIFSAVDLKFKNIYAQ